MPLSTVSIVVKKSLIGILFHKINKIEGKRLLSSEIIGGYPDFGLLLRLSVPERLAPRQDGGNGAGRCAAGRGEREAGPENNRKDRKLA